MSQKKRMNLCSSCDGFVDLDVIVCPYCGSDMSKSVEANIEDEMSSVQHKQKMSVEETLSSLYPPPYKPKNIIPTDPVNNRTFNQDFIEKDLSENAYLPKEEAQESFIDTKREEQTTHNEKEEETVFSSSLAKALPVLLFSLGVNILLLGLYLLIFSTNGEIFIRWNAAVWYVYLLVGVPFVFVGYRMLSKT